MTMMTTALTARMTTVTSSYDAIINLMFRYIPGREGVISRMMMMMTTKITMMRKMAMMTHCSFESGMPVSRSSLEAPIH